MLSTWIHSLTPSGQGTWHIARPSGRTSCASPGMPSTHSGSAGWTTVEPSTRADLSSCGSPAA
jgi:hypothetical protein